MAAAGLFFLLVPLVALGGRGTREAVDEEWAGRWRGDLGYLAFELPRTHPRAFATVSREDFEAKVDDLMERIPELAHHEIITGLAEIVASVGDGHSRLTLPIAEGSGFFLGHSKTPLPSEPDLIFHPLPLRLHFLEDGLFIQKIPREHASLAGSEILSIGGKSVSEAVAAVKPVVHHDNEQQLLFQLPDYLVLPEILHARGVTDSLQQVEFRIRTTGGEEQSLRMAPLAVGQAVEWVDAREGREPPLYQRDLDRHFWLQRLEGVKAAYWRYNTCYSMEDESTLQFAERLRETMANDSVERLIIDLRGNRGGNNSVNRPLLQAVIRSEQLHRPGSLFALIDRGTFSAAMMFIVDLEAQMPVLFVGEAAGSAPNSDGDPRKLRLPGSGLTVRISALHHQSSGPRDRRRTITPHLPVPLTSADYRAGRDPALEALLARLQGPAAETETMVEGEWQGQAMLPYDDYRFTMRFAVSGEAWTATFDVPEFDAFDIPLPNMRVQGTTVSFDVPLSVKPLSFRGWLEGDQIFGIIGRDALSFPAWLRRVESPDRAARSREQAVTPAEAVGR